jgi:hypothetical protein
MEENVVSAIGGVGVYGIISISTFFAFFTGTLIWVCFLKKSHIESMVELPMDDGSQPLRNPAAKSSQANPNL